MRRRGVAYRVLSPARYASELHRHVRTHDRLGLIDTLIVGAFIEARSCERLRVWRRIWMMSCKLSTLGC